MRDMNELLEELQDKIGYRFQSVFIWNNPVLF